MLNPQLHVNFHSLKDRKIIKKPVTIRNDFWTFSPDLAVEVSYGAVDFFLSLIRRVVKFYYEKELAGLTVDV